MALREQHAALEELKRQLADRVAAVREREVELQHALNDVVASETEAAATAPAPVVPQNAEGATDEDALQAARREKELLERERTIAEREVLLESRSHELESRSHELESRSHELESRSHELDAMHTPAEPPHHPDEAKLAQIDSRVAELRGAETLFLRTRDELAARSEAVAARERLVSQREREDAEGDDRAASPEFSEMEARLRRLEQQQQSPGEQTLGFSGGLRKLEQGTRQQRPS